MRPDLGRLLPKSAMIRVELISAQRVSTLRQEHQDSRPPSVHGESKRVGPRTGVGETGAVFAGRRERERGAAHDTSSRARSLAEAGRRCSLGGKLRVMMPTAGCRHSIAPQEGAEEVPSTGSPHIIDDARMQFGLWRERRARA